MPLDIKPLYHDGLDCLQSLMITFANWIGRSYKLTFANTWGFDFKKEDTGFFGDRISSPPLDIFGSVKKYCNIEPVFHFDRTPDELLEIIRAELEKGYPVIIETDLFYCSWSKEYYQKGHAPRHTSMAVGLNDDCLLCIDCVPVSYGDRLPLEDFRKSSRNCATFSVSERTDTNIDFKAILAETLNRLAGTEGHGTVFDTVRQFAAELNDSFEWVEKEINHYGAFVDTRLFKSLTFIAGSRTLFSIFLMHYAKEYSIHSFHPLCEDLNHIASNWNLIRSLLMKASIISMVSAQKDKIIRLLYDTADQEEKIYEKLLQWYRQSESEYTAAAGESGIAEMSAEQDLLLPLDLTAYVNNNGIGNAGPSGCTANLSGSGFFLLAENLPDSGWLEAGEMKFRFPVIEAGRNDNISCQRQTIPVPGQEYSGIMLLGCAEWGHFSDYIEVASGNGGTRNIQVYFTDCVYNAFYGEKEAWEGHIAEINEDKKIHVITKARLFAAKYSIGGKMEFDRIVLPYCPNIHIFAISLYN